MLYSLIRPVMFRLDAEEAHHRTLSWLKFVNDMGCYEQKIEDTPVRAMGIEFANPVGLAAGLDKNGEYIDALADMGFGFIEVGTVTPRPQAGNEKPRLFRIPEKKAIINRMGFNNAGVDQLIENIKNSVYQGVLGINIGKNADTPVERATEDYLICLEKVYNYASYVTVNISSPNTKDLRSLQNGDALIQLLSQLRAKQLELATQYQHYVPLVLKVAPDLDNGDIEFIAAQLLAFNIDGLIVTNTSISRAGLEDVVDQELVKQAGGLSGQPIFDSSTLCLKKFADILQGRVTLIGVGGICSGDDAAVKIAAGATMVQLYSGLVYTGPSLIKDCVKKIAELAK